MRVRLIKLLCLQVLYDGRLFLQYNLMVMKHIYIYIYINYIIVFINYRAKFNSAYIGHRVNGFQVGEQHGLHLIDPMLFLRCFYYKIFLLNILYLDIYIKYINIIYFSRYLS